MAPRVVHLVPHTHWDREWYLPFQRFRLRLVRLIDRVLDAMEADPRFVFTLDGQLATVDDYLEVRPEAEERIRALVQAGRLAIGPWHVLMDEYLVSGESILRNLELGLRRAEELGGAMPVGYLPDQFGHVTQMPQILRRAGLEHAAVWRGVPAAVDRHVFRWVAPDGSWVRTEYLPRGYGNAANVLDVPERLGAKVQLLEEAMRPFFGDDDVLAMYGTDHTEPSPDLVETVERANAAQTDFRLVLHTLADYFGQGRGSDPRPWPEWTGELRSAARANLLPGVASARIDLKAACARAERLLERYAEPLQALWGESWPDSLLALAWRRVIENSAHDSICGCSADEVCRQVLVRFDEAEQIGAGLVAEAVARIAADAPQGATAVVNPSPHPRSDLVELDLEIPDEWDEVALALPNGRLLATQELGRTEPLLFQRRLVGHEISEFLDLRLHGRELFGRKLNGFSLDRELGRRCVTFDVGDHPDPVSLDVDELRRQLELAIQAAPEEAWLVRILARPRRTVAASVPVPPLGWTSVRPTSGRGTVETPVRAEGLRLSNGILEAEADADGTLTLGELRGVARIVDGGDFGDSYNYAPPQADSLVDRPESVAVDVASRGPLRAELSVRRTYNWPVGVELDGSARTEEAARVEVTTRVELRAGEPFARLRISFDNRCRDHRVRLHIPLAHPATGSAAEGQFAVVERGLEVEGGYGEAPIATYPARGFVDAGGVAVLLEHVLEYEVVDGRELALTLLRSVGLISRNENPWRQDPAGPELAIPEAQLLGPRVATFAVFPHADTWTADGVLRQMERYQHPFLTAPGTSANGAAQQHSGLELEGDGVVLSSLRRREGHLELTLTCEEPSSRTVTLRGASVPGGDLRLELGAWEIRTIRLQ